MVCLKSLQTYVYCLKYLFIGAVEKQKLVYILNRDATARLTISSPLEAHKSHTLVYHTVGVDVGFENPMFACLEMDYEVLIRNIDILNLFSILYLVTEDRKVMPIKLLQSYIW